MTRYRWHDLKDPFPAWSHWFGAALSLGATVLLWSTASGTLQRVAFAVYGASMVLLYLASALAHSVRCGPRGERNLDRFDYTAIFLLIAGTYTPFCLVALRGAVGWWLFAAVWATAAFGIVSVYWGPVDRHWARVLTYVLMGWLGVLAAGELSRALPRAAVLWTIGGGVVYTVGALVYMTGRPRLWPGRFGSHDLWHCMVLAGSACHFIVIFRYIAPAA